MATVKFFAVRLFIGEEETFLHLKGHKALTKRMVKETILSRWPSAEIDDISMSSRGPLYKGDTYLAFDEVELAAEQPFDWLYAREESYDSNGEEYLSGRQFRLPNNVFFELQQRARKIERKKALNGRKRLSKEVRAFLKETGLTIENLKAYQRELSSDKVTLSIEDVVIYLKSLPEIVVDTRWDDPDLPF